MKYGISLHGRILKRSFDIVAALFGLLVLAIPALIVGLGVLASSRGPALFRQRRIGRAGIPFWCVKFRTMYINDGFNAVTTAFDPRITPLGAFLRAYKLDELPQLFNVLTGKMSFVGPRPDISGYADLLEGEDRIVLTLRPGITGPASLFFRNEEAILALQADPRAYNDTVIWPIKVSINRKYAHEWRFLKDIAYILITIFPPMDAVFHCMRPFEHYRSFDTSL